MNNKVLDMIKLFWNMGICVTFKHIISEKDWNTLTPLLPSINANCTRCGFPFILYLNKDGEKWAKAMYEDPGGF